MTIDDPIPTDRNRADDLMRSGRPAEAVPRRAEALKPSPARR